MLKSYEAVYSHGHLRWIHHAPPELAKEMRVIVVLEVPQIQDEHVQESKYPRTSSNVEPVNEPSAETLDILSLIPKHRLGKIHSSLRREDIYTDAR